MVVKIGQPTITGDLDKAIILRYMRRNRPRIKHCYERRLLEDRTLKGTVEAIFTISPNGSVLNAGASGVHREVERCVAGVIKKMVFPKPKGGGIVIVRHPFQFRLSGG